MNDRWLDSLRSAEMSVVCGAAGMVPLPSASWAPCPSCGAETRGSADRRGPIGVRGDGGGWRCHRCTAHGDVVTLAAIAATGEARPSDWRAVRAWAEARGLLRSGGGFTTATIARPRRDPCPAPTPAPTPAPRPPADDVRELWDRALPVIEDIEAAAWMEFRGLDPATIADLDLMRAIPPSLDLPRWARFRGTPWTVSGHRIVARAWDAAGEVRSLHARNILPDVPAGDKAAWPAAGHGSAAGLVMADAGGLCFLRGGGLDGYMPTRLIVAEGLPDFVTWATNYSDGDEDAPGVIGITAGSWTDAIAERIPDGCEVTIATHDDDAGEEYARKIHATIAARCRVTRWKPTVAVDSTCY